MTPPSNDRPIPAEIRPGELWPIKLLHVRLGWGARTRAAAVKQGLRVHRWGKLGYVATDDLISFLKQHEKSPARGSTRPGGK